MEARKPETGPRFSRFQAQKLVSGELGKLKPWPIVHRGTQSPQPTRLSEGFTEWPFTSTPSRHGISFPFHSPRALIHLTHGF